MFATKLHLIHYRGARDLTIDLEPRLNLFVGVNGAGKSTILDGMSTLLTWAAARLRSINANGQRIRETDIHNDKNFSIIEIHCRFQSYNQPEISWRLTQTRKGRNPDIDPDDPLYGMTSLRNLNEWANKVRDQIGQSDNIVNIPLFVYYPVNRSVLDIPLRIRKAHTFDILDAYDNAFTMGANFRDFFEWFRTREDLENERYRETGQLIEDPLLNAVRKAILAFLPEFSNISIKRNPLRMEVTKKGNKYRVDQMSDGEKCLIALIGDLARRLAIANPNRENPLEGEGIILIDEIDLHLHPEWQRMVAPRLIQNFPNCQFIISTHSPQVFGEVDAQCIRRLTIDPLHGITTTIPEQSYGLDSSEILEEQMEANSRDPEVTNRLNKIFHLIDLEQFIKAKQEIKRLQAKLKGKIPELVRADALITMLETKENQLIGDKHESD